MSTAADRIIEAVRRLDTDKRPTPKRLENECGIPEADWRILFGTWDRVMVAARQRPAPVVRRLERLAGQSLIDESGLVDLDARVKEMTNLYEGDYRGKSRHWILNLSDMHDIKVDPFWLRVVLETVRYSADNLDVIVLNGDIWDGFEFSRHTRDFREWQLGRRIHFVHNFLAEIRKHAPHVQIVFVEGNHEHWILRYFNEKAPELMALFSDLHDFSDVASLLGIHKFGITYCSQARLTLPTLGQIRREVKERNWWCFKDVIKFTHYRPSDKDVVCPGVNGHHHSFELRGGWYRPDLKRFGWLQTGCGARQLDGWASGDSWDRGFAFIEMDTEDQEQQVKMHPIYVSDSANIFGLEFKRDPQLDLEVYMRLGGFTEWEISRCYRPSHVA